MTDKRRLISLLPAINQTEALIDFFGVTVDEVFQPGTSTPINGYIGEFPPGIIAWATNTQYSVGVYVIYTDLLYQCINAHTSTSIFDPTQWSVVDFYVQEPDAERANYQLEPGMVTTNTSDVITDALTYPDLINYLSNNGGLVNNQQRLFETDYYSWAPPIDIDKFVNYQRYYWFGDATGPSTLPTLILSSPILKYTANGSQTVFAYPDSIEGISSDQESLAIYVNGVSQPLNVETGALLSPPADGATVITTRFDNLYAAISGQANFPILPFLSFFTNYVADGFTTSFPQIVAPVSQPNITETGVYYQAVNETDVSLLTVNANQYTTVSGDVVLSTTPAYGDTVTVVLMNGLRALDNLPATNIPVGLSNNTALEYLSSGMSIQLLDTSSYFETWDESPWDSNVWDSISSNYFVDGVGQSIRLTESTNVITGINAQYVTIDRSSLDGNPWSIRNSWVHADTFAWSGLAFSSRQAVRPIIEFVKDIVLFNYGYRNYSYPISATISNSALTLDQIGSSLIGTVYGDPFVNNSNQTVTPVLQVGSLVLLLGSTQNIYYVNSQETLGSTYYELLPLPYTGMFDYPATQTGDVVEIANSSIQYWYNGTTWALAQTWAENIDPRFMLYDIEPTIRAFDDTSTGAYPGSNFDTLVYPTGAIGGGNFTGGNRIFGYQIGSNTDTILQKYISYDSNGYIMFENDTVPWTIGTTVYGYTYAGGSITSLACYATSTDGIATHALWYKSTDPVTTTLSLNSNGFYDIPLNLEANPLWDDVTTLSKSEYASHFYSIISNQAGITGTPFYDNNFRDTAKNLGSGNQILQHQAPMLKCMLLASDTNFDMPSAIRYADQEYTRFKNKFSKKLLDLLNKGILSETTAPATCITTALNSLKTDKNNSFPFWLSTMAGGTYFIPPTPAFLGVMPLTNPSQTLINDTTYETTVPMIQGHDGSLSPAFQDWRDDVFIALETQIYTSILNSSEQSKFATQERPALDFDFYVSNVWYPNSSYPAANNFSVIEVNQILSPIFERWAQTGHFDFRTNTSYDPGNPFSWNYRGFVDRLGNPMPGSWRAIYNLYFDTDRPHTNPWEMLGFTSKPSWWDTTYPYKPYGWSTSVPYYGRKNTTMWNDLIAGNIQHGPRAGINPRYARPGLAKVIPVIDDITNSVVDLLDPISAQIMLQPPDAVSAARNWEFGDEGPVEHLWRTSSSFPFAKSQALFLMKPPRFAEMLWDTVNFEFIGDQWVDGRTLQRPIVTSASLMHGETNDAGSYITVFGIQQWLVDNLVYAGQTASLLGNAVRGIDVNLIHRVAGFVSSDGITAQTDNFGLIPTENVQVALYQAPPENSFTYSGVIVEWTGFGYRVIGYDSKNPYFTILPPDTNGPSGIISLSTTPQISIYTWAPSTYYRVGVYVNYKNSIYQCITAHTSSANFNESYWNPTPGVSNTISPSIITYVLGLTTPVTIPYGTTFNSIQDVGSFLLSWERYLVSCGWVFDQYDSQSATTLNWTHAAKDFLTWAQVSWKPGNFIALSPGATGLKFVCVEGSILNVEDSATGFYGLVDRAGLPIYSSSARVNRLDGQIELNSINSDIYGCTVEIADIEHLLIFSNTTIFDDIIYLPLYNQRQPRILLTGFKSSDWAGRLDAPGYIVLNDQMFSNFEKNPEDIRLMFDIEEASRPDLKEYAQHNIGYQTRSYLENLLINTTEQFEFYQGMIAQKGAPGVFEKLLRSQRVTSNSDIVFLEEWAIRYPTTFGAPINPLATFNLLQSSLHRDPQFIIFDIPVISSPDWLVVPNTTALWSANTYYSAGAYVNYLGSMYQSIINQTSGAIFDSTLWTLITTTWIDEPASTNTFFPSSSAEPQVPTAGFARVSDVQYTALGLANLSTYYTSQLTQGITSFNTGERIWVYTNAANTWDILRIFDVGASACTVNNVTTHTQDSTVSTVRLYMTGTLNLVSSDIGAMVVVQGLTHTTPDLNGIGYISAFNIENGTIDLTTTVTTGFNFSGSSYSQPVVKIFRSVRFATNSAFNTVSYNWLTSDLVWIDDYESSGNNVVLSNSTNTWEVIRTKPVKVDPSVIITSSVYNNTATILDQQLLVTTPLVDDLTIIDPLAGFLPGAATKEITFMTDVDPAIYSYNNGWNATQIGIVWWNTSTVKFLDPYTDNLGQSDERDFEELQSRIANWATIAPNTSVDVYEWVASTMSPTNYAAMASTDTTGTYGTVYNTNYYTTAQVYDASMETNVTYYYFWVKNLTVVPNVSFRETSVYDVASLISSPLSQGLEWIAAISQNSILVSGINPYLNNTSSVVKIELDTPAPDHVHSQWTLIRPNDQQSLPPEWLWRKIRDSLAGFDDQNFAVPNIGNVTNEQK